MPFIFEKLEIPELMIITSKAHEDKRGYFFEGYKKSEFEKNGILEKFSQDNFSCSKKNVLRGLHFQLPPKAQSKLVRVVEGKIWDVAVDVRKTSPTFKKWVVEELSEENGKALYIPGGFAHGFVVLSKTARVLYKTSEEYEPKLEKGIVWNDKDLNITWPIREPVVSAKDGKLPGLSVAEIFDF